MNRLPTITTDYRLSTTDYRLPTTDYRLSTIDYVELSLHCLHHPIDRCVVANDVPGDEAKRRVCYPAVLRDGQRRAAVHRGDGDRPRSTEISFAWLDPGHQPEGRRALEHINRHRAGARVC